MLFFVATSASVIAARLIVPRWHLRVSEAKLVWFTILFCLAAFVPFGAFLVGLSPSWTGLALDATQHGRISTFHVPVVVSWFIVCLLQLFFWRVPRIHRRLGVVALFLILPALILELCFNAAFVFVPNKQIFLAQSLGLDSSEWWKMLPMHWSALVLPLGLLLHYVFSMSALFRKKRSIRLHVYHMMSIAVYVMSPGVVRYLIQGLFAVSGCEQFGEEGTVMQIQTSAFILTGIPYFLLATLFFVTLDRKNRKAPSVQIMYWWYVGLLVIPTVYAAIWGFELIPQC
ncbi:MAG: hypothetical protein ACI9MC_001253 [Kiritimatiellia bacterium]|jgi:hypothetical protein